jgi:hypothetical protein
MGLAGVFGAHSDEELVASVLHALDSGINFIDTARLYGRSEELIGRALRSWQGAPPFVATKVSVLGANTKWGRPPAVDSAFPRGHVTREIDLSLTVRGMCRRESNRKVTSPEIIPGLIAGREAEPRIRARSRHKGTAAIALRPECPQWAVSSLEAYSVLTEIRCFICK